MPYLMLSQLSAVLPPQFLVQALDDDGDGNADPGVWESVVAAVSTEIDGNLGSRFATPFANPIPAVVADAALKLAAEALYLRRGFGSEEKPNPWAARAKEARARLAAIAAGDQPLTPDLGRQKPSASAITERAKATSKSGRLSA